jgi:hypothetical protein
LGKPQKTRKFEEKSQKANLLHQNDVFTPKFLLINHSGLSKFSSNMKKVFFSNFPGTVIFPFQPCQAKCKDPDFLNAKTENAMFHP